MIARAGVGRLSWQIHAGRYIAQSHALRVRTSLVSSLNVAVWRVRASLGSAWLQALSNKSPRFDWALGGCVWEPPADATIRSLKRVPRLLRSSDCSNCSHSSYGSNHGDCSSCSHGNHRHGLSNPRLSAACTPPLRSLCFVFDMFYCRDTLFCTSIYLFTL